MRRCQICRFEFESQASPPPEIKVIGGLCIFLFQTPILPLFFFPRGATALVKIKSKEGFEGWPKSGFIFGALCPSKSGLMNKHIVKHIGLMGLVGLMPLGALYPSKSGLMNKHIVNGSCRVNASRGALHRYPSKSGLMNKHIVKHKQTKQTYHGVGVASWNQRFAKRQVLHVYVDRHTEPSVKASVKPSVHAPVIRLSRVSASDLLARANVSYLGVLYSSKSGQ